MEAQPRWMTVTGWVLGILALLVLASSVYFKIEAKPEVVSLFTGKYGYARGALPALAAIEIAGILLYLIPRTAVLSAIILAGYLGGAAATHLRAGEPFWGPILVAVFLWGGLFLRDGRLRALIPLRR